MGKSRISRLKETKKETNLLEVVCAWWVVLAQRGEMGLLSVNRFNPWCLGGVRHYIKNFWSRQNAFPFPGHMAQRQGFFQHRNPLKDMRQYNPRPKESRRLKKEGYNTLMTSLAGRKQIFEKIMKDDLFRGEF